MANGEAVVITVAPVGYADTHWVAFCGQTFTVTQKRKVPNSPEDTKDPWGLSCADADTVDLSPLKELTNIRVLNLEDTGAEDLSTLSQLKQLTDLFLWCSFVKVVFIIFPSAHHHSSAHACLQLILLHTSL